MSLSFVRKNIMEFISYDLPEVMVIKGDWGVGKTYCWDECLRNTAREKKLALSKYSYVSLFGINSLECLKNSIFENVVYKNQIGHGDSFDNFIESSSKKLLNFGKSNAALVKDFPFIKNFIPMLDRMSFLSLKETLICIDDIERRGKGLTITDVLGLISMLKEQRKCKIVILLNENELRKSKLNKYKEKVIDYEVEFHPTSEECVSLAFGHNTPDVVKGYCNALQIKNIRVLKKIERLSIVANSYLSDVREMLKNEVMHSLVLFVWCYYCSEANKKIPTLDFIRGKGIDLYNISDKKEKDPVHAEWDRLLMAYKYYHTSELDVVILSAVISGYFDKDDFLDLLKKRNDAIIRDESSNSFTKAWDKYHNSFTIGKEELVNTLYDSYMINCRYISAGNLNGTVTLMKSLNEDEKAREIINKYVSEHSVDLEFFNLNELNHFGDIKDPDIVATFRAVYEKNKINESAKDVLGRIAGRNGWNPKDIDILANTSAGEYYDLFTSELGEDLVSFVSTCLKFGDLNSSDEKYNIISNNAKKALCKIAGESDLNRLRVLKYGIELPD